MKARPMDTAGGTPGPAGRSDHASFSGPSSRTTAETRREAGAPLSGALGAALLAAAALLLAPGDARAAKECGNAPANVHLTCSAASYPDGIFYGGSDTGNWLGGYNTITIAGSSTATTTITAKGSTGSMDPTQAAGVYLRAGVGVPWVSLIMGGETDGTAHAVNVVQGTNTNNAADRNNGVYIQVGYQQTGAATVDLKSGVTIGSAATPMKQNGVFLRFDGDGANWGIGRITFTSAATIFAAKRGILVGRNRSNTAEATTITNSGAIRSGEEGIYLYYAPVNSPYPGAPVNTYTGGATITNSGAITVSGADKYGIVMDYRGRGAIEIDNSGAIAAAAGSGILLAANGDLVSDATLTNSGDISVATLGLYLEKRNGSGTVTLTNSGDVRVTAAAAARVGHAIYVTEGATGTGAFTISNSGVLRSKNHALYAQMGAANTADLEFTNSGAVTSENGDGIRLERGAEGDVTFVNGGTSTTSGNVSGRWHGIYIGKAARLDFDQTAGTISGPDGRLRRGHPIPHDGRHAQHGRRGSRARDRHRLDGRNHRTRDGDERRGPLPGGERRAGACLRSGGGRREGRGGDGPLGLGRGH